MAKESEESKNDLKLYLYPYNNEYIAKLTLPKQNDKPTKKLKQSDITTVIILDRSGSMGDQVERFIKLILCGVLENLGYEPESTIYLIPFDDVAEVFVTSVEQLKHLGIYSRGGTSMSTAVKELYSLFETLENGKDIFRILTISDGELFDQEETQKMAQELAEFVKDKTINSQAIRLFTSLCEPDTRGLSSMLQLNNVNNVNLLDLAEGLTDDELINEISRLFEDDGLVNKISISSKEMVFKKNPWVKEHIDNLTILPGENIFWLKKLPDESLIIDERPVTVVVQPELNLDTYAELFKTKIQHYLTQLKILKVINTKESAETIENIVNYFKGFEGLIINNEEDVKVLLEDSGLRSRLEYLKALVERRNKTFSMTMSQIANDEKISQLNSAQQAEYLRSVDNSRNSRGLARRALNQGIDFNQKIRDEIKTMSENLNELDGIDDGDHSVSFFSRETTLGGIRAVCELYKDDLLDDLVANEIFLIFNLVGVGCSGPIGDFPDPMTWRVNELHLGCTASLSDVLMAFTQAYDKKLKSSGTDKEITNVIPIFEDYRIMKFLRKHAPSLLEYICSVGMRRVIAEVPMTCGYTLCAGVWKAIELLDKNKSELHIKTFDRLLNDYSNFVGGYFDHILNHIKEQNVGKNSYYIANNGITNMINPIFKIYKSKDTSKRKFIPSILRALYSYEIWQAIRRLYKHKDNSDDIIKEILYKLLGIDLNKNKTPLAPMYELEPESKYIKHHDIPEINEEYLKELVKSFYYVRYVSLFPQYFEAVASKKPETIKDIPKSDEIFICEQLDINYDLKTFHLYNIVQALFYTTKQTRVDTETESMKILDLKHNMEAEKMVRDYVAKQFHNQYLSELAKKKRSEQYELASELVKSLLNAPDTQTITNLMSNGITRGKITLKIVNSSSLGYKDLKQKLTDMTINSPLRTDLIRIFLLGRDSNDTIVWNNGGVNFVTNLTDFGNVFKQLNKTEEWDSILKEYKERGLHIYRELMNRHGHGNPKPSYWAFGYPTLQHYKNDVTEDEFMKYCKEHSTCCGVKQILELMNIQL